MKAFLRARHFVPLLLLLAGGAASAATGLQTCFLVKEQNFFQVNDVTINPASKPFTFQCNVETTSPNPFGSVYLHLPSSSSRLVEADGPESFRFENIFTSKSSLDLLFGPGTYTLEFLSEATSYDPVTLTMPADDYPPTPALTNTLALQSINPSNVLSLAWLPFSGGTTNDYVQFNIEDFNGHTIFQTGEPGAPNALNGTNTSVSVPAGTLAPGETYSGRLLFARLITQSNAAFPDAHGFIAFAKETELSLVTTGTQPTIQLQPLGRVNGHFQFLFTTQPGRSYQIQYSDALPVWNNLWFTNASDTGIFFTDPYSQPPTRFYRVIRQ